MEESVQLKYYEDFESL